MRLHPNLSEVYRQKVIGLSAALPDPAIRDEALGLLRGLIETVELRYEDQTWQVDLKGEIARLVEMGSPDTQKPRADAGAWCSVKVVAGARNLLHLLRVARFPVPLAGSVLMRTRAG